MANAGAPPWDDAKPPWESDVNLWGSDASGFGFGTGAGNGQQGQSPTLSQHQTPAAEASKKPESDIMLSLLDGFMSGETAKTTSNAGAAASRPTLTPAPVVPLAGLSGLTQVQAKVGLPSPPPATPNPPPVASKTTAVTRTSSAGFDLLSDVNPFLADVDVETMPMQAMPMTTGGNNSTMDVPSQGGVLPSPPPAAAGENVSSLDLIPGFDDFVTGQLKKVEIEEKPKIQEQKPKGTLDKAPRKTIEDDPLPSYESVVGSSSPAAPQAAPETNAPPAYEDVADSQQTSKADLDYLWPMPFIRARLMPQDRGNTADLSKLVGTSHNLLATPNVYGGLRVWKHADGTLDLTPEEMRSYSSYLVKEDGDASPAFDIPNRLNGGIVCMTVDNESSKVWAGHSTGEVTCWDSVSFKFLHVFKAHRNGQVNDIVLTSVKNFHDDRVYKDLWTGSSRGSLRIWKNGGTVFPQSGQNSVELRRSDGERAHGRITALLHVPSANVIWSCGIHSLALWDATSGAFICSVGELEKKTLNALEKSYDSAWSGTLQRRSSLGFADQSSGEYGSDWDSDFGNDMGSGRSLHSSSRKAKEQVGSLTKRATKLLGKGIKLGKRAVAKSVDTVYNATSGVAAPEAASSGETLAIILDANDNVWVVYNHGTVEIYSKTGKIIKTWKEAKIITCICRVKSYIWAGLANGQISIWDSKYEVCAVWRGHQNQLQSICSVSSRVYTLSTDGCINGWHYKCPIDWNEKYASWILKQSDKFLNKIQLTVFAGTWNVNQMKLGDIRNSLPRWIESGSKNADIAIIGLEEIEMGSRTVAESIVKETFAQSLQERGNLTAQTWLQEILVSLTKATNQQWHRIGSRQLSGILLGVYVREHLKKATGEVETCSVARGVMGVGGNKGTVGVSLSIYRRKFLFLCSHFAAHQNAVDKRNEDYMAPVREMKLLNGGSAREGDDRSYQEGALFDDAHLIVWVGDFNYRVDMPYTQACEAAYNKNYRLLQENDQLLKQMAKRKTFVGFKEGVLNFPPTYKFDKKTSTYDTSEKQRIPAWCDRVLYRTKKDSRLVLPGYGSLGKKYINGLPEEPVNCCLQTYNSCHDIVDSDHKPVYAVLNVGLCCVNEVHHRKLSVAAMGMLEK